MPTAVAVAGDGTVYIADGARNRVLVFRNDGTFVSVIASMLGRTFSRPMSVKVGPDGRVWIADTGNRRIVVFSPDGSATPAEYTLPAPEGGVPVDITDMVPSLDGRYLWAVDNDNHRLSRIDLTTAEIGQWGERGESLGRFEYPLMVTTNRRGDVLISEALGGRVQVFDEDGRVVGSIAAYGADMGNLYRAKGVAVDPRGNVWVVDGTLDVIQIFRPNGILVDVLRGSDGRILKFDTPFGIAIDAAGDLYLTELMPNRVRKFKVRYDPAASGLNLAARRQAAATTQPRTCAACHTEWLEPLASGVSTRLMDPPDTSPEHPAVTRPRNCLGCHDGSVVDSRRPVWGEHGHRIDFEPPQNITVPEDLPLLDGKIVCRTCHSAHTRGGSGNVLKDAVFLRTDGKPATLCVKCHTQFGAGPEHGMHPLGKMDRPVPEQLVQAGARITAGSDEIDCFVCHEGHGAEGDLLLVAKIDSNQLCLACHEQMRPGMFRAENLKPPHPFAKLSESQKTAVEQVGGLTSTDGRLICLSCHKMHQAPSHRYILAFGDVSGNMCLRCHDDKRVVVGGAHDLRTNFPDEKNQYGQTPEQGGVCSACHLFHNFARPVEQSPVDPAGECVTCHQADRVARKKALDAYNHPDERCTACHNPHDTTCRNFLVEEPPGLCLRCHEDQATVAGGPHDFERNPPEHAPVELERRDPCLSCHRTHGTEQTGPFRVAPVGGPTATNGACLACHPNTTPDTSVDLSLVHPTTANAAAVESGLPLFASPGGADAQVLGCETCHDPHTGGAASSRLLRAPAGSHEQTLCLKCHADMVTIRKLGHAVEILRKDGFADADACQPCHVMHADPTTIDPPGMWPKALSTWDGKDHVDQRPETRCTSCHREGGPVAPPAIAIHPKADMFNPFTPDEPGYLPLWNDRGEIDPKGHITCLTCHLTHGRTTPGALPAPTDANLTPREQRARQWHLRSFGPANVCSTCHGIDALRRIMYFHDPQRRGGPIDGGGILAPSRLLPRSGQTGATR